jgi:putative transposase
MLTGIKFSCELDGAQAEKSQLWMDGRRLIWNGKTGEEIYLTTFARKYMPIGTYFDQDKSYAQFKGPTSEWLNDVPSQILRDAAFEWARCYQGYRNRKNGKPKFKSRRDSNTVWLERALFRIERQANGEIRLFIGSKTNAIGYVRVKWHKKDFAEPNSIRLKRNKFGKFTVSFCYDDGVDEDELLTGDAWRKHLGAMTEAELRPLVWAGDRGVAVPLQAQDSTYQWRRQERAKLAHVSGTIERQQRAASNAREKFLACERKRVAEEKKNGNAVAKCRTHSKRGKRRQERIAKLQARRADIRDNFAQQASHDIVERQDKMVFVFEDLKGKNMTRRPKAKRDPKTGKWLKNGAAAKAGLNRAILNVPWFKLWIYTKQKAHKNGKVAFKVNAMYSSQECAVCGHTHRDNRKSRARFVCAMCGHENHADVNAAEVLAMRAIRLLMNPGTGLSKSGTLIAAPPDRDTGRGAGVRPGGHCAPPAAATRRQKRRAA